MGFNEIRHSLEVPREVKRGNSTSKKIRLGVTLGEVLLLAAIIQSGYTLGKCGIFFAAIFN
jgi:hypothetical protein